MRPERLVFALVFVLLVMAGLRDGLDQWVARTKLPVLISESSVEVRDRRGRMLRIYTVADGRWRLAVTPGQVDRGFLEMLIAYEDKRFYRHGGVDPRAMLRAISQAVINGKVISGGSTLTMQVARLLENSGTGKWRGKLRQIRLALALERRLSKDQILALYLTRAPYGGNLEGVRAASLAWFSKEPIRLTPAESALLVALPQSPETRRPDRHHAASKAARAQVLERMKRSGNLSDDAVTAALSEPVPTARAAFLALAPHLSDQALAADPLALRHDLTIDAELQQSLEKFTKSALFGLPDGVSIAMVVADHRSGEILASVGSAGYHAGNERQGFVDMTRVVRSPGSTLKPLVYAMAFDRGLAHPQTLINDRPVAFGRYAPQNFDGQFRGEITVAHALRQSLNIPVVLLLDEIGPAHLMQALRRAGVQAKLPGEQAGLAVALGGVGVTLRDLVQLYAMLAEGGQIRPLFWRTDGNPSGLSTQMISRVAAWQVSDILAGMAPPKGGPSGRIAYKTGTSYGNRDAWAIGFDGAHVAGVWIGRADGTPVPGAFGGDLAAPVLFEVFQRLKPKADPFPAPPPETLILSTAELPQPLRRFTGREAVFKVPADAPKLIFPPEGAILAVEDAVPVKVRDGKLPFTWLANGVPVLTRVYRRETALPGISEGFSRLTVIDAAGRASRVNIEIE